ncbi:MAG: hypothetical protein HYV47_04185 [Candidatus Nealsonbacteria bacterium]|nr:hypothetical protein [Candidatus Nealsonbacteria bacterium]
MKNIFLISVLAVLFFSFILIGQTDAAILSAVPEKRTVIPGEFLIIDIKANTEDVSVNAAQATVRFPSNILELTEADKTGSVLSFWVEEPLISNEDGTLKFIGGTVSGVSGSALQILKIKFKAVGAGTAEISMNDAVITANDGRGTNVLSMIQGTNIAVSPEAITPKAPEAAAPSAEQPQIEQPQPIEREAVPAAGLPSQPKLRVPLYPDESRWYNHLGEVVTFWDVPDDVIKIATAIDHIPSTSPENVETDLFTGKSFGQLSEGVWYIHVQFKNNIGWGPETHYKISIDTTPPLAFEAGVDEEVNDNPAPKIFFETFDSLSGVSRALIYVDNQEPIETKKTSLILPLQPPGKKLLKVRFFDLAGNSVEDDLEFEILALPTPIIEFVTKRVSRDEAVFISGAALPSAFVDLRVYTKAAEVLKQTAQTDTSGKWGLSLKEPLLIGDYTITATSRDERGALSFPSAPEEFKIRPRTILSIGPVDFGYFEIFIIIILMIFAGAGFYGWYYFGLKKKRESYAIIIARDVEKMHNLLENNLIKLEENLRSLEKFINPITKDIDPTMQEESLVFIGKMKEVLGKIKKYVKKEVEELR